MTLQERLRPIGEMGKREPSLKLSAKPGVLQKPPLPNKQHPDTFLNLSQIHPPRASFHFSGTPHGPATPATPALRTGASSRTVRGARKSVRIIHDFDLLESFWRREREYLQSGTLTCKYPWMDRGEHVSPAEDGPLGKEGMPTLQPMPKFQEWLAQQEAELEQLKRGNSAQDLSLSRISNSSGARSPASRSSQRK